MGASELERLARRCIDAWNRSDPQAYRDLTDPGFVYTDNAGRRRVDDLKALFAEWKRLRAAFPDATAETVEVMVEGNLMTVAGVVWRATQSGLLFSESGPVEPSFKCFHLADVIATRWRDGRAVKDQHHVGLLALLAPLLDGACRTSAPG